MDQAVEPHSRVHMDVEPGERVVFAGTGVEVEFVAKSGRMARLIVTTPREVPITRAGGRSKHAMIPSTDRG
jgi:hypothetical protein